ncbi:hypothetical protein VIBNISOn1_1390045 [Vibrio nigripulchritudo SOn1]|uniref:Uncharacterized protein n=1 Tax=Vibrio nigripulchritudo SOn1 TaxID=1238450 RepID=A0AAV2VKZ5_9VIBR|nr:hypothetical protein VIBNISOn1_1390045 [Vibrio nigripulchritudo SOn1]
MVTLGKSTMEVTKLTAVYVVLKV